MSDSKKTPRLLHGDPENMSESMLNEMRATGWRYSRHERVWHGGSWRNLKPWAKSYFDRLSCNPCPEKKP